MPNRSCGPPSGARARVSSSASTTCSSAVRPAPPYSNRPREREQAFVAQHVAPLPGERGDRVTVERAQALPIRRAGGARSWPAPRRGTLRLRACSRRARRVVVNARRASASRRTGTSASTRSASFKCVQHSMPVKRRRAPSCGDRRCAHPSRRGATSAADRHSGNGSTRGSASIAASVASMPSPSPSMASTVDVDRVLVHDDLEVVGGLAAVPEHRVDGHRLRRARRSTSPAPTASTAAAGRRAGARRAGHRDAPDRALRRSTRSGAARTP